MSTDSANGQGIVREAAEALGVPTGALVSVRRELAESWEAVYWQDCQRWRAMLARDAAGVLFMAGCAEAIGRWPKPRPTQPKEVR